MKLTNAAKEEMFASSVHKTVNEVNQYVSSIPSRVLLTWKGMQA
jgi:hypothetical protein